MTKSLKVKKQDNVLVTYGECEEEKEQPAAPGPCNIAYAWE